MKKLVLFLILLLVGQVNAIGYGSSIEGDSAGVTLTLNVARDSAWIRFASPYNNFYDSVKAVPISGTSNKILIAPYLDLDTLGGHIIVAYTFTGDTRTDTIAGAWYHRAAVPGVNIVSANTNSLESGDFEDGFLKAAKFEANAFTAAKFAPDVADEFAAYPDYIYKMVARGSPTTMSFEVSYISPTATFANDWFNGLLVLAFTGNPARQIVKVADFAIADSTFTIRPGLTRAFNSGDTVFVLPNRGAIEAVVLTNDKIAVDGSGYVSVALIDAGVITAASIATNAIGNDELADDIHFDSLSAKTLTIINTTSDPALVIRSTSSDAVYLQASGGLDKAALYLNGTGPDAIGLKVSGVGSDFDGELTAANFATDAIGADEIADNAIDSAAFVDAVWNAWQKIAGDSASAGSGIDSATTSRIIGRKTWGIAAGSGSDSSTLSQRKTNVEAWNTASVNNLDDDLAMIFARDISSYFDSTTNNTFGQFAINIGLDGVGSSVPTIQMKAGDYSGAVGSNVEDDFDTAFVKLNALLEAGGGLGSNACSIYVKSGAAFPANITVMLSSGGTNYFSQSDANGLALFILDDGTYSGYALSSPVYSQDTIPQTFTFSAAYNDTLTLSATTVGAPAGGANYCSTYIWTYDLLGDSIQGAKLTAIPQGIGPWVDTNYVAIWVKETVSSLSNINGYAAMTLYRTSVVRELKDDGTLGDSLKYDFELTYPGSRYGWKATDRTVPDSASWWIR